MFTKYTYLAVTVVMFIASTFQCLPLRWKSGTRELKAKSWMGSIGTAVWLGWIFCYAANVWSSFYWALNSENADAARLMIDFLFCFSFTCVVLLMWNILVRKDAYAQLITKLLSFNGKLTDKIFHNVPPCKFDGCEVAWLGIGGCFFFGAIVGIFFILAPQHPRHLFRNLPSNLQGSRVVFGAWVILEVSTGAVLCLQFIVNTLVIFIFTSATNFWLKYMRKQLKTDGENTRLKFAFGTYGSLRIVEIIANTCTSAMVWPVMCGSLIGFGTMGIYGMVTLHGSVPITILPLFPVLAVMSLVSMFALYPVVGSLETNAESFLQACLNLQLAKVDRKRLRATRTLGMRVGTVIVIKKTTALTSFMIISNLTINLILMHS